MPAKIIHFNSSNSINCIYYKEDTIILIDTTALKNETQETKNTYHVESKKNDWSEALLGFIVALTIITAILIHAVK